MQLINILDYSDWILSQWTEKINEKTTDEATRITLYDFLNYLACAYEEREALDGEYQWIEDVREEIIKDYNYDFENFDFAADWDLAIEIFCEVGCIDKYEIDVKKEML